MPRVLSVGQCGYDHGAIAGQLSRGLGAEVVRADTFSQALKTLAAGPFDLILVNRVSDADGTLGLDLIRALKADPDLKAVPVMLVSNYEDAQHDAEALGALPGFGKAELNRDATLQRLRDALVAPENSH